jgi:hypothetical protein
MIVTKETDHGGGTHVPKRVVLDSKSTCWTYRYVAENIYSYLQNKIQQNMSNKCIVTCMSDYRRGLDS